MEYFIDLAKTSALQSLVALSHNWPYLAVSILLAAALKVFVDAGKISGFMNRFRGVGLIAATTAAVATPLCSCGTTAVLLGMMANSMPLAPIVAFMVASPLSSPEELFYSAGLFGWPFSLAYFAASILLGLAGGLIAAFLEKKGFLKGQLRFSKPEPRESPAETTCGCACGCDRGARENEAPSLPPAAKSKRAIPAKRMRDLLRSVAEVSGKLLPMFLGFGFIGYLLNHLIPASWISGFFGQGRVFGVPLAATIGLPLYLSSEASLPLVRAFLDSGMSQGAVMAFLIAGSGTSMGAIAGALMITRWKVVGLVVAVLWVGAILAGYGFDLLVNLGMA